MANILAGLGGLFEGVADARQQNQTRALRALQMAAQQADLYNSGVRTGPIPTGVSVTPDPSAAPTDSIPSSLPWPSTLPTPDVAQVSPGAQSALDGSIFSGQSPSSASPGGVAPALSKQMGVVAALRAAGGPPPSPSTTPAADSTPPAPTDASSAPNPLTGKITFANPVTNGESRYAALSPGTYIDNQNTPFAHTRTIEALKAAQAMGLAGFKYGTQEDIAGKHIVATERGQDLTNTDALARVAASLQTAAATIAATGAYRGATLDQGDERIAQQGAQQLETQTQDLRKTIVPYVKFKTALLQSGTNPEAVKPALMNYMQAADAAPRMSAFLVKLGMNPSLKTTDQINQWIGTKFNGVLPPDIAAGMAQVADSDYRNMRDLYQQQFTAAQGAYRPDQQRFFNRLDPKVVFDQPAKGLAAAASVPTSGLVTVPADQHLPGNPFVTK